MRIAIITSRNAAYRGRGYGAAAGSCPLMAEKTKLAGSGADDAAALSIVACVQVSVMIQNSNRGVFCRRRRRRHRTESARLSITQGKPH